MSWRQNLRPASFRGVPFFVAESETNHSRRLVVHQYPQRDDPYVEDMGRGERAFSLSGYIVAPNYFAARDALIKACEAPGPGVLIHPYRGTRTVCCRAVSVREDSQNGGAAFFTMDFVQAGLQQYPTASLNPLSGIGLAVDKLIAAARNGFLSSISVSGVSDFVTGAFQGTVSDIGGIMAGLQSAGGLMATLGVQDSINQVAQFSALVRQLENAAFSFISNPAGIADALQSVFSLIGDLSPTPDIAVAQYRSTRALSIITRDEVTPQVTLENRNKTATKRFSDLLSLAGEARQVPLVTYASYDDAVAARDLFISQVDSLAPSSDDAEYLALQDLRTQIARSVPGTARELPRLVRFMLADSQPSLVVAYDLYGKVSREAEISERNKIAHPGFVPGGVLLEVLSA